MERAVHGRHRGLIPQHRIGHHGSDGTSSGGVHTVRSQTRVILLARHSLRWEHVLIAVYTPIGCRSCRNIAEHSDVENVWQRLEELLEEFDALREGRLDVGMTKPEHLDALSKLKILMNKAKRGVLDFGGRYPDAKSMDMLNHGHILELRPLTMAARNFGRVPRILRMYYVEPRWNDRSLLGLHMATKPDGFDQEGEQNRAIIESGIRADLWDLARNRRVGSN